MPYKPSADLSAHGSCPRALIKPPFGGLLDGSVLVKRLIPDFGSGHYLTVCEMEPRIWLCADRMQPAWDSLIPFLFLCPSRLHMHTPVYSLSLSLSQK